MWQRFKAWVLGLFGKVPEDGPEESFAARYEDITSENITATISNKLAVKTFGDSTLSVEGEGRRVEFLGKVLQRFWRNDIGWVTAQAFGKGGMVIVPTVTAGTVVLTPVDQERLYISARRGDLISSATLLADTVMIGTLGYKRWMDYTLDENGVQSIETVITDDKGMKVPFSTVPVWADIEPLITIANTDRLLLATLPCPRDNRTVRKTYGVPITYGAQREIADLTEHWNIYRREYRLSRMMLALDSALWASTADVKVTEIADIKLIKKTVQDDDTPFIPVERSRMDQDGIWESYAPEIRHEAMHVRLVDLQIATERACGLSQGILSEMPRITYTNKDEIRAVQADTFAVITDMRETWESAIMDLAYAIDVYAERFGLTPAGARGAYELKFDWDFSAMESSHETYEQLKEGRADKVISRAEHRQWLKGGTIEEAEKAIAKIDKEEPSMGALLGLTDGDPASGGAAV